VLFFSFLLRDDASFGSINSCGCWLSFFYDTRWLHTLSVHLSFHFGCVDFLLGVTQGRLSRTWWSHCRIFSPSSKWHCLESYSNNS